MSKVIGPFHRPTTRGLVCAAGMTRQEFARECDINSIVTRSIAAVHVKDPSSAMYGDFSSMSFDAAMETVSRCSEFFERLPSATRDRFGQSVERFMSFVSNPENAEACYELGIFARPSAPAVDGGASVVDGGTVAVDPPASTPVSVGGENL